MNKIPYSVLVISLLVACTHQPKPDADIKPKPTIDAIANGNKVVYFDSSYADYIKAMKADYTNRDSHYMEIVGRPIYNTYFAKSTYSDLATMNFRPFKDTTGLLTTMAGIQAHRAEIDGIISTALTDCNKYLKDDSMSVYVLPLSNDMKDISQKMGGITAVTVGSKQILLTIDSRVTGWMDMLKSTIAHEFNHAYWTRTTRLDSLKFNLLTYLVFEGRGDSYAHFLYPDIIAPWTRALSDSAKAALWKKIKPMLHSEDSYTMRQVMFGFGEYPVWGGYALGYAIVQSALKNNPKLATPADWANLKPEEILSMSDYK